VLHLLCIRLCRTDIDRMLGEQAWCISFKDSACRCFGFMLSKKRYIYTIDDDCFVAKNPTNEVRSISSSSNSEAATTSGPASLDLGWHVLWVYLG